MGLHYLFFLSDLVSGNLSTSIPVYADSGVICDGQVCVPSGNDGWISYNVCSFTGESYARCDMTYDLIPDCVQRACTEPFPEVN